MVNPNDFEVADEYLDVFQIGARNMQNLIIKRTWP